MVTSFYKALSIKKAAVRLGLCTRSVYKLIEAGELGKMKIYGNRTAIPLSDIEQYIKRQRRATYVRNRRSDESLDRDDSIQQHVEALLCKKN